ncbi:hypothetical protein DXT99_25425 [Pontibacter diazotrophicus]|uniref:Uncharacterized protein n=1 Tax=Pontibacter diazotrophicus TaxID=1400979 RepID=A0A3D8L107_9BACT|nr:hypothetical protein [Pontibacter diazotrophicus]RDV11063.1 hypothetical protein DXT99_25425 [Pontibacter diazotrophicus]
MKMKFRKIILILLFIQCATSSFQCDDCNRKDMYLDGSKSWVPLRGTGHLAFEDKLGNTTDFAFTGLDTTVINTTECGELYNYQYINNTLYLNQAKTDSIYFNLFNTNHLNGRAVSNNTFCFAMWAIHRKAEEGKEAKKMARYRVGSKTYDDVILIFNNKSFSPITLDSVIIANNVGLVGFTYYGKRYHLK